MRAVLYCRVSDPRQAETLSLATQEEACRDFCRREGYDVDRVFIDAGESAKTVNRPEFRRLLAYCRESAPKIHAVVVYSLTRFARNSADHHAIAGLLRGLGITLKSVTEPIDDTSSGKLMEGILAAFAQFDNDLRSERITAGMQAAIKRGRWVWPSPIGYRNGPTKAGPSLTIDPVKGPLVRLAFELVADGRLTGRPLRKHLTELGLRAKHGAPLTRSALYRMLRHQVYLGRIVTTKGDIVHGDFDAIVTPALFQRVQLRLDDRGGAKRVTRHRNHPDFPFRRFVRCEQCGASLTGSWSTGRARKYGFYHCRNGCTRIPRDLMEKRFLALLERLQPRPEFMRAFHAVVLDVWREAQAEERVQRGAARLSLSTLETQLARLEHAFLFEERVDQQTYRQQRDKLREEMTLARVTLNEVEMEEQEIESLLAYAEHALSHASAIWTAAASVDERMRIQATLFPDGLVWRNAPPLKLVRQSHAPPKTGDFVEPSSVFQMFDLEELPRGVVKLVERQRPTWREIRTWLTTIRQGLPAAA